MIHFDGALALIESLDIRLGSELIPLADCLGRVPTVAPISLIDQPPFDKATMDGFAYARTGGELAILGERFRIVGSIAAGERYSGELTHGDCVRIMTGAPVPSGTAAVHRLERSKVDGELIRIEAPEEEPNIVRRAANRPKGEVIFERRPLKPQDIGLLAANGIAELQVCLRPKVRVLSTGGELVEAIVGGIDGERLEFGRIFDSNGPQLVAQAQASGCEASFGGIVPDYEASLMVAIDRAASEADLVIVSGGVSAGDFDYVPRVAERIGFDRLFHGIAMKPGKPAFLGRRGDRLLYGMPGNPLSAFVNFEMLVRPILSLYNGLRFEPVVAQVVAGASISRRELDRVEYLPVSIKDGVAMPLRFTGSTMLDALSGSQALVRLEIGQGRIEEGEEIDARLI
jgi:molybdopterin molybdotransferase